MIAEESIYQNEILFRVPLGLKALSARKLELDRIVDGEKETMSALYDGLADEFEGIGYQMVAGACRKRALQWRQMATGG
jgi:hypothetical protein